MRGRIAAVLCLMLSLIFLVGCGGGGNTSVFTGNNGGGTSDSSTGSIEINVVLPGHEANNGLNAMAVSNSVSDAMIGQVDSLAVIITPIGNNPMALSAGKSCAFVNGVCSIQFTDVVTGEYSVLGIAYQNDNYETVYLDHTVPGTNTREMFRGITNCTVAEGATSETNLTMTAAEWLTVRVIIANLPGYYSDNTSERPVKFLLDSGSEYKTNGSFQCSYLWGNSCSTEFDRDKFVVWMPFLSDFSGRVIAEIEDDYGVRHMIDLGVIDPVATWSVNVAYVAPPSGDIEIGVTFGP